MIQDEKNNYKQQHQHYDREEELGEWRQTNDRQKWQLGGGEDKDDGWWWWQGQRWCWW
jgi:hypothetical protein